MPFTEQAGKPWRRWGWERGSGSGYILSWNEDKIIHLKFLESVWVVGEADGAMRNQPTASGKFLSEVRRLHSAWWEAGDPTRTGLHPASCRSVSSSQLPGKQTVSVCLYITSACVLLIWFTQFTKRKISNALYLCTSYKCFSLNGLADFCWTLVSIPVVAVGKGLQCQHKCWLVFWHTLAFHPHCYHFLHHFLKLDNKWNNKSSPCLQRLPISVV